MLNSNNDKMLKEVYDFMMSINNKYNIKNINIQAFHKTVITKYKTMG